MPRYNRRGTTLIELVVVIAIIAVLTAILVPAYSSAREASKATLCASNLHQISLAESMYLNDNNDTYPAAVDNLDRFNFPGQYGGTLFIWIKAHLAQIPNITVALAPYSKDNRLFDCPSDVGGISTLLSSQQRNYLGPLFSLDGLSYAYQDPLFAKRASTISNPEADPLFFDRFPFHPNELSFDGFRQQAFADGHVSILRVGVQASN